MRPNTLSYLFGCPRQLPPRLRQNAARRAHAAIGSWRNMRTYAAIQLAFFLSFATAFAAPQSTNDDWKTRIDKGQRALSWGQYDRAEGKFTLALDLAESFDPLDPRIIQTLSFLGSACDLQGKLDKAASLLERALSTDELARGIDHPFVATTACNLASVRSHQGKYKDSHALYERALDIQKNKFGPESLQVARTLSNMSGLTYKLERLAARRAAEINDKTLPPNHPDRITALENYAALLRYLNRPAEADAIEQRLKAQKRGVPK